MSFFRRLVLAGAFCVLAAAAAPAGPVRGGEAPAEDEAGKEARLHLAAMDAARKALVRVVVTPRWNERAGLEMLLDETGGRGGDLWADGGRWRDRGGSRDLLQLFLDRRTVTVAGVVLKPGLVAVPDGGRGWDQDLVGKVEVADAAGRRWTATFKGVLTHAPGILLAVEGPEPPAGVEFRRDYAPAPDDQPFPVGVFVSPRDPARWFVEAGGALLPFDSGPAQASRLSYLPGEESPHDGDTSAAVLFDGESRPVGVLLGQEEFSPARAAAWNVGEMLSKGVVSAEALAKAREKAAAEALGLCCKVRFEFRAVKDDDEDSIGMMMMARRAVYYGGNEGAHDAETFGVPVGGGRVFIPRVLEPGALQLVDKVSVKAGEEWQPAKFVGVLRDFTGMLVEAQGPAAAALAAPPGLLETAGVERMRPFIVAEVRDELGRTEARTRWERYLSLRRGYADRLLPVAYSVPKGALLFDAEGKLAGICLTERRPNTLLDLVRTGPWGGAYQESDENLAGFAALAKALADPAAACEPRRKPMTDQEARRLCWLGVEFDPINRELAKRLGVLEQTSGGNVGLIVSCVYPGSPAEKMGVKPRDVLLSLRVEGLGQALPLLARFAEESARAWGHLTEMMGHQAMVGMATRTWKPRANPLTLLLTAAASTAGEGRKAQVVYLAAVDKSVKRGEFEVGWAPPDYDSADKLKDEKLGLTLKPLTYEVRAALGLAPEAPGVVIAKVEDGSPAQVSRVTPFMLVTQVDGQPVRSLEDFKKLLAAARADGRRSAKLQVSAMGQSRFADVSLEGAGARGGEAGPGPAPEGEE